MSALGIGLEWSVHSLLIGWGWGFVVVIAAFNYQTD